MAKKAKAKKAKASKKKTAKKSAPQKPTIVAMTPDGLKRLGARPLAAPPLAVNEAASARTAGVPAAPTRESFVTIPGMNGSTVVCFFNPNTGNFDRCHTVAGSLGFAKT